MWALKLGRLQQKSASDGIGFNDHPARQQSRATHVGCGSKPAVTTIETFMAGSPHVVDFAALAKGRFAQSLMDSFGQV
jgi:hypothetical protein